MCPIRRTFGYVPCIAARELQRRTKILADKPRLAIIEILLPALGHALETLSLPLNLNHSAFGASLPRLASLTRRRAPGLLASDIGHRTVLMTKWFSVKK